MNINEFISSFKNHPVLFIGTGFSLRYLENSYSWDNLLKKVSINLFETGEEYYNIKSRCEENGKYNYEKIATILEAQFNDFLEKNRNGKFKYINDIFFENMENDLNISRFKIYISELLSELNYKDNMHDELVQLKKVKKNIGSIITTNYDKLIEDIFDFIPLVGNDILLSNPYGAVYKIHGSISEPRNIIITVDDYLEFSKSYELIRAQLLSLFIHNPIIFLGYSISDKNIKDILKTIFSYVRPNTEQAKKIRDNFLLVEYEKDSTNLQVIEHDIDIEGFSTLRINKFKTDNYLELYKELSKLQLPVSAMDIRKVQNVMKEITSGGEIEVKITEDIDSMNNSDKILVIGSSKSVSYDFMNAPELMDKYFNIIEEENAQILQPIDKIRIQSNQYFPMFGFEKINPSINSAQKLKEQQVIKINEELERIDIGEDTFYDSIDDILKCDQLGYVKMMRIIFWSVYHNKISIDNLEEYLKIYNNKDKTSYRKLLCLYDWKKHSDCAHYS